MNRSFKRTSTSCAISVGLAAALLLGGCATKSPKPDSPTPITEVSLEAPTAPTSQATASGGQREVDFAALKAENQALSSELERIQTKNRAYAMETARLREEVAGHPAPTAAPEISSSEGARRSAPRTDGAVPSGVYTVQTASYAQTDGGRRAADKLCEFFQKKGFSPASYRESGKFLIVLVGAYGSKDEASTARGQIAALDYYGRKGDFKSSTIRKN